MAPHPPPRHLHAPLEGAAGMLWACAAVTTASCQPVVISCLEVASRCAKARRSTPHARKQASQATNAFASPPQATDAASGRAVPVAQTVQRLHSFTAAGLLCCAQLLPPLWAFMVAAWRHVDAGPDLSCPAAECGRARAWRRPAAAGPPFSIHSSAPLFVPLFSLCYLTVAGFARLFSLSRPNPLEPLRTITDS